MSKKDNRRFLVGIYETLNSKLDSSKLLIFDLAELKIWKSSPKTKKKLLN